MEQIKIEWERTRIQTFFLLSIQIPKKQGFTYEKFKKEWRFAWEKTKSSSDPSKMLTVKQWDAIINKPVISTKKITANSKIDLQV